MSNKKTGSWNGKGYYIALILCAAAIGISGYLYYSNANDPADVPAGVPDITVEQPGGDLQADATMGLWEPPTDAATQPSGQTEATQPSTPVTRKPLQTASPVQGQTVAVYAMDRLDYNATTRDWRTHNGVDIAAEAGTPVCAAAAGTVYTVYEDETMGTTVVLRHADGYVTSYASLDATVTVAPGDQVALGQQLGTVGSTALLESALGEHVHFSVSCNDVPMDPAAFLGQD